MSTRLASLILAASAVVASYIVILIGHVLPKLFASACLIAPSSPDLVILMPPITQFATRHTWVFAFVTVLICVAVVLLLQRRGARVSQLVAVGLSAQALVVWFAMFCFCYDGFSGGMCLHHGPEFELGQFFQFAFGVFPVTLCAIVAPGLFALLSPNERNT